VEGEPSKSRSLCEMTLLSQPKDSNPITAKPRETLLKRLEGDLSKFADQLDAVDSLLSIFTTQPPEGCIDIIVKVPATGEWDQISAAEHC
jgi:hypothetical protein